MSGVELATGYVNLTVSARGISRGISNQLSGAERQAQSSGSEAGQRFGSGFLGTVGKVVTGIAVFKGIGKAFDFAKSSVFGFNSQLEQADIGFTTMLGSAQKSQAFLEDLKSFAKSTPFEFTGLVDNAQTMLGMGVAAKDVLPTLTALGDSVASVGGDSTKLNNTILAFSQTMAKGTLDMGNMNQMLQGGVPNALKILAASYGVTTGEMVKMISAGKVQSQDALPRLVKGIEEGTKATAALGGMMDRQSKTASGALANISDSATQLVAGAFKPLFSVTSSGLQRIADALGSDTMQKWADRTASGISRAITVTKGAIDVLRTGDYNPKNWPGFDEDSPVVGFFFTIREAAEKAAPVVSAIGDKARAGIDRARGAIEKASPGIRRTLADTFSLPPEATKSWQEFAVAGFGKAKDAVTGFAKDAWGGLQTFLDAARPGFEKLWAAVQPLLRELGPALKDILPLLNPFKLLFEVLRPMLPQIAQTLGQIASIVGGFLASALTSVRPLFEALVSALSKLIPFVQNLVAQLLPPLVSLFQKIAPLLDALLGALEPVIDAVASALIPVIEALEPVVERVFGFFADSLGNLIDLLGGVIDFITGIFTGNWSKAWNGIKEIFGAIWDQIKNVFSLALDAVMAIVNAVWPPIRDYIVQPVLAAWNWVTEKFNTVKGWVGGAVGAIGSALKVVWDGVQDYIVQPVLRAWNWMTDKFNTVKSWISGAISGVASALKVAWDWVEKYITDPIKNAWDWIVTKIEIVNSWVSGAISAVANALKAAWDWVYEYIIGPVRDAIAWVKEQINALASWMANNPIVQFFGGNVASGLAAKAQEANSGGGFGGGGMFAKGTNNLPDGYSIINELGPELLYKRGPNVEVITAGRTQQVLAGRDAPLIGQVVVQDPMDPFVLAAELDRRTKFLDRVR
jgi:tape measure domain-containing protein